jgi:hypothetical protein
MGQFPLAFGRRYEIRKDTSSKFFSLLIRQLFRTYNRLQQIETAIALVNGVTLSVVFTEFEPLPRSSNVKFKAELKGESLVNNTPSIELTGELRHPTGGWLIANRR